MSTTTLNCLVEKESREYHSANCATCRYHNQNIRPRKTEVLDRFFFRRVGLCAQMKIVMDPSALFSLYLMALTVSCVNLRATSDGLPICNLLNGVSMIDEKH